MLLQRSVIALIEQLQQTITNITDEQYCHRSALLSGASVGQHLRHVIEFFLELNNGYKTGMVNYDQRKRDHRTETDRLFAIEQLRQVVDLLNKPDKELTLIVSFPLQHSDQLEVNTNYYRELLYNLEHMVHHMALIRVGIEAESAIRLPEYFGVAESTIQFRKVCAR